MKNLTFSLPIIEKHWEKLNFDCLAFAVVDFKRKDFSSLEWEKGDSAPKKKNWYFDLASLTKPLTLSASYFLKPEYFGEEALLCIEHRGGLPAWGRLSKGAWREKILSFKIKESETLYSDYSAIRAQLLVEEKLKKNIFDLAHSYQDKEMCHWLDLPQGALCPVTGYRQGKLVSGAVHDDNAFFIGEKVAHAGMFSTIDGVAKSLLNLQEKTQFLSKMVDFIKATNARDMSQRYVKGFDRVQDFELTNAGKGAGPYTFGHLGFTGTSFWIDPERERGHILLTNSTRHYWYVKEPVSLLRRELGAAFWKLS